MPVTKDRVYWMHVSIAVHKIPLHACHYKKLLDIYQEAWQARFWECQWMHTACQSGSAERLKFIQTIVGNWQKWRDFLGSGKWQYSVAANSLSFETASRQIACPKYAWYINGAGEGQQEGLSSRFVSHGCISKNVTAIPQFLKKSKMEELESNCIFSAITSLKM